MFDGIVSKAFEQLLSKVLGGRESRREARALLRLFALELRHNIAMIDTLRGDADDPQWSEGAIAVAKSLQNEALSMVFLPQDKYRKLHAAIARLKLPEDGDGVRESAQATLESLWVRVRNVQALGRIGGAAPPLGMRDIRLRQRLLNLRDAMLLVLPVVIETEVD
jgi:hypothetical protein